MVRAKRDRSPFAIGPKQYLKVRYFSSMTTKLKVHAVIYLLAQDNGMKHFHFSIVYGPPFISNHCFIQFNIGVTTSLNSGDSHGV